MNRGRIIIYLALAVVLSAQGTVFSDSYGTGLEEIFFAEVPVTSSGFFKTDAKKAPGYTTVVDAQTIENLPIRSLEDLQEQLLPGQIVANHQSYGPDLGVRGVYDLAKDLYLINGQSVNHRMSFGWAMESRVPLLGDVNRVEVINGPGGIVNGSGAISGMTNIITKNGTENPGFFTKAEYGFTERLKKGEAGYGKSYGEGKDFFLYAGA